MSSFLRLVSIAAIVLFIMFFGENKSVSTDDYTKIRNGILSREQSMFYGDKLTNFTEKEKAVNAIVLQGKKKELTLARADPSKFLPSKHFFQAKTDIEQSPVFNIIRKFPKGSSLHTHLTAAVSVDFLIHNISYNENLYGCFWNGVFKLKFLNSPESDKRCEWKLIQDYRREDTNFDSWLRRQLSLEVEDPTQEYPDVNTIWQRFKKIFTTVYDMLCYKPVFQQYIFRLLQELYDDNVFYTELRSTIMPLYDLNNVVYSSTDFFDIFINTVEEFKRNHPKFLGVRYIHSIYRGVAPEVLKAGLDELRDLKKLYPNFIAGFDFVGYEEEGKMIVDYQEQLLEAAEDIPYFLHAGETNWYGSTDLNLLDAILLNSSRIGHAFALSKHPVFMELVRAKDIAVELCPISNQVLMLNSDSRNHPAASLLAKDVSVVVGNDDPSAWGATGLSYDWYVAFMAMTPENAGIEVLKKFARDSFKYSAMTENEKAAALVNWNLDYQTFLDEVLANR